MDHSKHLLTLSDELQRCITEHRAPDELNDVARPIAREFARTMVRLIAAGKLEWDGEFPDASDPMIADAIWEHSAISFTNTYREGNSNEVARLPGVVVRKGANKGEAVKDAVVVKVSEPGTVLGDYRRMCAAMKHVAGMIAPESPTCTLTVTQAATATGFTRAQISKACNSGDIKHTGKRHNRRINPESLTTWAAGKNQPDRPESDEAVMRKVNQHVRD